MSSLMGGYGGGPGWAWMWPAVLVCGLAALVWGLLRARSSGGNGGQRPAPGPAPSPGDGRERARDILRERFARGEITEDELHDRMKALDGT